MGTQSTWGGIAAAEAQAGFDDGVEWTVYALSRGPKEEFRSLCDFAWYNKDNPLIRLITGKDSSEANAFSEAWSQEAERLCLETDEAQIIQREEEEAERLKQEAAEPERRQTEAEEKRRRLTEEAQAEILRL